MEDPPQLDTEVLRAPAVVARFPAAERAVRFQVRRVARHANGPRRPRMCSRLHTRRGSRRKTSGWFISPRKGREWTSR